jgi:hypothetical protein
MRRKLLHELHGFHFARRDVVALEGTPGTQLRVRRGRVWLTQEGDARDILLGAGESFRLDRPGRAVVEVLLDCEISLLSPPRRSQRARLGMGTLVAALDLLQGAMHAARLRRPRIFQPL